MPRKLDYIDLIRKQGAFVLPPKPKPEPVPEPAAVAIIQTEPVAEAVARLQTQWNNPDPQRTTEIPATEYAEYSVESPEQIGDICDLVVVSWGRRDQRSAVGLARVLVPGRKNTKGSTDGIFIRETNVVTEGEIRVGTKIRAKLAPPDPTHTVLVWLRLRFIFSSKNRNKQTEV